MDISDAADWTEMDIEDLNAEIEFGRSIEEAATFLCRADRVNDLNWVIALFHREACFWKAPQRVKNIGAIRVHYGLTTESKLRHLKPRFWESHRTANEQQDNN
jgi:hypothetical protein